MVELLLQSGHTVTVVDNYSTGSERNLAHLLDNTEEEIFDALKELLKNISGQNYKKEKSDENIKFNRIQKSFGSLVNGQIAESYFERKKSWLN